MFSVRKVRGDEYAFKYDVTKSYANYLDELLGKLKHSMDTADDNMYNASYIAESLKTLKDHNTEAKNKKLAKCYLGLEEVISQHTLQANKILSKCFSAADNTYFGKLNSTTDDLGNVLESLDINTYNAVQKCRDDTCRGVALAEGVIKLEQLKRVNTVKIQWLYRMAYSLYYDDIQICFDKNSSDLLRDIMQSTYQTEICLAVEI